MQGYRHAGCSGRRSAVSGFAAFAAVAMVSLSRPASAQIAASKVPMMEQEELPHPFFTHMGLPERTGAFHLRLLAVAARAGGQTDGDVAFHLETGLTDRIGLHIRNDRVRDNPLTEVMFQFAAVVSKDGMSGFAPIIEFEVPTRSAGGNRVHTLVGFSSTVSGRRVVFNQVLHYNPREDGVDGSAALVFKLGKRIFPVVEVLGEGMSGMPTVVNLLGGLKVQLRDWLHIGLAVSVPLTTAKDFSRQVMFGPDLEWKR